MSKRYDPYCTYNKQPDVLIDYFSAMGDYYFLSNFYPSTIVFEGKKYPTVEHAYQANKTLEPELSEMIRHATTCGAAKRMGRIVPLRPDWETFKLELMRTLLKIKFENPLLRSMLLATGEAKLVECNTWNDTVWGTFKGEGQNLLGNMLMDERTRIKNDDEI